MKKIIFLIVFIFISSSAFSQVINDSQIINGKHWIYDSFNTLSIESGIPVFTSNTPLTAGALRLHFQDFDRENLSASGKKVYDKAEEFLFTDKNLFPSKSFKTNLELKLAPELCYKSNENIDWTYNYYYKDNPISLDIDLGVSDYFSMGGAFFLGKNYLSSNEAKNFTNLPLNYDQFEFLFPRFTYGSIGGSFNEWGFDFSVGKEGLKIGNTKTGSIIYNDTFETEGYVQLHVYTNDLKYTGNLVQVSPEKFLYWHQIDVRLFNKIKIGAMEGALVNESLETRFLNPLMVYHSYSFWKNYSTDVEQHYYNESHSCSYLGLTFEINPVKYLRIYGLYAQNELQAPNEQVGRWLSYPDSIGGQIGAELKLPSKLGGYWNYDCEVTYCSPYLYIKQAPEWSLYKTRKDMITWKYINSWIGSPLGPDTFAVNTSFGYEESEKWSLKLGYLMCLKGENGFDLFDENKYKKEHSWIEKDENGNPIEKDKDGNPIVHSGIVWDYYPYTQYVVAYDKDNKRNEECEIAVKKARNMWMSGTCEYKHQISLDGSYKFNKKLAISGQFIYSFIFNANHIPNNFEQGIQAALSFEYKVF